MNSSFKIATLILSLATAVSVSHSATPEIQDLASVKKYLVDTVTQMKAAAGNLHRNALEYQEIVVANEGDPAIAYAAEKSRIDALIAQMQDGYKAIDSFGYETVEGIVAGVSDLAQYDIDLDAGVPASEGPDDVAQITLELPDGSKIDKEGALFTYILEPALWSGDERWVKPVDLDGDGELEDREALPRPEVIVAAAKEAENRIGNLLADSEAWVPTVSDAFGAMITMTPTLPEYFEDWKESRYGDGSFGKFSAVSRVSDMKGIMSSCAVLFQSVASEVNDKDAALEASVTSGYDQIQAFLDDLAEREKGGNISAPLIEELASQAKEKTDKLVPQIQQASALVLN